MNKPIVNWVFDWKHFEVSALPEVGEYVWVWHGNDDATSHKVKKAFIDDKGVVQIFVGEYRSLEKVWEPGYCVTYPRPYSHIRFNRSPKLTECREYIFKLHESAGIDYL